MDYEILSRQLIEHTGSLAAESARRRKNYNFHNLEDRVQRMLNAMEPSTYIRPHRHINPRKVETFIVLRGKIAVFIFDDDGKITYTHICEPENDPGIDLKAGTWHTIVSLESKTVCFESKDGPYDPFTDKDFAPWAPKEGSEESRAYLENLRKRIESSC